MATEGQARKERTKQGKGNPKKIGPRNRNGKPKKCTSTQKKGESKEKKETETYIGYIDIRRLSRITKPPLHFPRGNEPAMMLAHRMCPYTGRQSLSRIRGGDKHGTGCAVTRQN
jgi:hypothetical protein